MNEWMNEWQHTIHFVGLFYCNFAMLRTDKALVMQYLKMQTVVK